MDLEEPHQRDVLRLRQAVRAADGKPLSLRRKRGQSNLTRGTAFKTKCHLLDLSAFNRILDIQDDLLIAEPLVTMEQMVRATLIKGLIPQVVPEFRGITIGGALMGAALESSSFRFGQFNDTIAWCEVILGNGDHLRLSPDEHPDLFYALAGSYGTLAIITRMAIRLMPAKPNVRVDGRVFARRQVSEMTEGAADYCDGLVFSPHAHLIMNGTLTDGSPTMRIRPWSRWWYQSCHALAAKGDFSVVLPLEDYLFRYDLGAFWMGRYLRNPSMLLTYLRKAPLAPSKIDHTVRAIEAGRHWQRPGLLFRALFGPLMSSQRLYHGLHAMSDRIVAEEFLIQDSMFAPDQVAPFLDYIDEAHQLWPIWLCPVKRGPKAQFLSPHIANVAGDLLINVGTYGVSATGSAIEATRHLERTVTGLGGRKALYSHSYYTPEEFWQLYDRNAYEALRKRYHAHVFPQLTDKVLTPC